MSKKPDYLRKMIILTVLVQDIWFNGGEYMV